MPKPANWIPNKINNKATNELSPVTLILKIIRHANKNNPVLIPRKAIKNPVAVTI